MLSKLFVDEDACCCCDDDDDDDDDDEASTELIVMYHLFSGNTFELCRTVLPNPPCYFLKPSGPTRVGESLGFQSCLHDIALARVAYPLDDAAHANHIDHSYFPRCVCACIKAYLLRH